MLVVGNRRYKKQYVIGGAGIFDSILQFLIRTFRQSFEFTMNKILFKVFGATSKDSCRYIYECLVLIMRTSLFVNVRTSSLVNSVHQIIYYVV